MAHAFTGQVACLLGHPEPRLNDLIRRGKIAAPPVVGGRRTWTRTHIEEAARYLGVDLEDSILETIGLK